VAYTFDGPNKLIVLSSGTVSVSVRDMWSRWADWLAVSDNSKYLPAMRSVGGDDIDPTAGTSIPVYTYLQNGWKVRPQEAHHTLRVWDGVLLVDGGGDPFADTVGAYRVRVNYQQPVAAIAVDSAGGGGASAEDVAAAVLAALNATTIPVDAQKINGAEVIGDGTIGNDWRGVGVPPQP